MDEAQAIKKEQDNWTKLYHKTLKGIKTMIDMQKNGEGYKKDSRSGEYDDNQDGRIYFNGKHQ